MGTIFGTMFYIVFIISLSYAWYNWKSKDTDVDLAFHDGGLKFIYDTASNINISNLSPILDYNDSSYYTDDNIGKYLVYIDYRAINEKMDSYNMFAKLNITSISDNLKSASFKWVLLEKENDSYSKVVDSGNFLELDVGSNMIYKNIAVRSGKTNYYRLVFYIDGNSGDSSSLMNGSIKAELELCDKAVSNIYTYVKNLYNDGSDISTVNVGEGSSLVQVYQNNSQSIMLDNNGIYRYYGANPNNYVKYNNELWRIVAAEDVDDGNGNIEKRVKLVRDSSIGNFSYDIDNDGNEGTNDWSKSDLMSELNNLYYNKRSGICSNGYNSTINCDFTNSGLSLAARSMIDSAKYYLGGVYVDINNVIDALTIPNIVYDSEHSNNVYDCSVDDGACPRATSWNGNVGIIYSSDLLYSADLSVCNPNPLSNLYSDNCSSFLKKYMRHITPVYNVPILAMAFPDISNVSNFNELDTTVAFPFDIYPTVYLKEDIVVVSGSGTSSNPYILQNPHYCQDLGINSLSDCLLVSENEFDDTNSAKSYISSKSPDLTKTSSDSGDLGLYKTVDNYGDSYYYRGAVENNYVKFAGYVWRIVRINGDNSIRLIYSGTSTSDTGSDTSIGTSEFNLYNDDAAYVGYKYGLDKVLQHTTNAGIYQRYDPSEVYFSTSYVSNDSNKTLSLSGNFVKGTLESVWGNGTSNYKYTCFKSSKTDTCTTVVEIVSYVDSANVNAKYHSYLSKSYESTYTDEYDSEIKKVLDSAYKEYIYDKGYSNYLADSLFCNDRSIYDGDGFSFNAMTNYSANRRNDTNNYSLICNRQVDEFTVAKGSSIGNGELTYPVGLITLDEVVFAGGKNSSNTNYYLYTGQSYWTMTPSMIFPHNTNVRTYGVLTDGSLNLWQLPFLSLGVRPVINLKSDVKIIKGNGSRNYPFIIK